MRSAIKIALIALYCIAFVCVSLLILEYSARRIAYGHFGLPGRQTELILDRWSAFVNHPNYSVNGVRINAQGFRRDANLSLVKPPGTTRIFLLGGSVAYGGETLYPEIDPHWKFVGNNETIDHYLEARLNSVFPHKRWEVVNAAVKGYFLNQDLALFISTLQRYNPDYLVLMDGVNDIFEMIQSPENADGYDTAGFASDFVGLTDPESMSLRLMAATWLLNHSALYRSMREGVARRRRIRARGERAKASPAHWRPDLASLSSIQRQKYKVAVGRVDNYVRMVRQIDSLAGLEGTQALFVLQPQIAVTRKKLTPVEEQLFDYWSRLDGPLDVYAFQNLYPLLSDRLAVAAAKEDYLFTDLTSVFDQASGQMFTDYCHLTDAGNEMVADAIFDSLAVSFRKSNTRSTSPHTLK
jgi:lysophospholipase L1-like esterase